MLSKFQWSGKHLSHWLFFFKMPKQHYQSKQKSSNLIFIPDKILGYRIKWDLISKFIKTVA